MKCSCFFGAVGGPVAIVVEEFAPVDAAYLPGTNCLYGGPWNDGRGGGGGGGGGGGEGGGGGSCAVCIALFWWT